MRLWMSLLALSLLGACTQAADKKPEEVRTVRVLKVGVADGARRIEYAGEVRPRHETRLAFRVPGKITERLVEVGAAVKAGQVVARLDASDLGLAERSAAAQLASLQAERDLAEADYKRYADLRAKNFISQAEYDRRRNAFATAESRLDAARAQHRQAANQAGYAVLVADTAGVITAIEAEAGQVVAAGQTVARLARPGEKEVVFAVPESQRELFEKPGPLELALNARPGKTWKGRLRELSPVADPATRTYTARATILDASDEVELGMSARAVLVEPGERRIEVPLSALYSRGEHPQVFVVGPDSVVQPRNIRTAGVAGERIVVASGLNPGDVVVAAGAQLLRPGQKVRVLNE
ncbi:MAG TPA: efflux RND transporter periplasmic adaptor subunit [Burkholderiales bacterium]|nr:efflux RND transporter periplasmic adaptor subunit [Burkholderiales bacterium]